MLARSRSSRGLLAGIATVAANGRKKSMPVENSPARIGKSVEIRGEVKGSEDLIVDGHLEGTITLSEGRLTIGATANVAADLTAKDVLILGHVQGNIIAGGRVELRAGCAVEGDIRALRLSVEDNAVFRGKVDLTQSAVKAHEGATPAAAGSLA
jgi:cytoskeletal protein CcmA (bactofilin family)